MKTTRDVELKIKKFEDIGKIVLSMKSIASLNLQKAQNLINSIRDYEDEITKNLRNILTYFPELSLSFRKDSKVVVVFGSDQGLCGLFNEKIGHYVKSKFRNDPNLQGYILIGKKLDDVFREKTVKNFPAPVDYESIYSYASELIEFLSDMFSDRKISEVYVAYNKFSGIGKYSQQIKKIIPFEIERTKTYKFPPLTDTDPYIILTNLITEYLFSNIYKSYVESFLSENGVRLMNMDNASKSIEKNIQNLLVEKNYLRQEEITDEIQEIISAYKVLVGKK
ncbi:F0F1 ATP synthase subunit gamma [Persephonella sp.]